MVKTRMLSGDAGERSWLRISYVLGLPTCLVSPFDRLNLTVRNPEVADPRYFDRQGALVNVQTDGAADVLVPWKGSVMLLG